MRRKCNFGVVDTDNYGGDYPAEKFIVQCWLSHDDANRIATILNDASGPKSSRYYKVVEAPYKLQPGFEP